MEKRYQVFVSSTFKDLQEERKQVIQALLELDCIPSGMELFQASDDDQWTLIKRVIDDCDYYLVIIAGRYGSMKDGVSFTEMEYDYAISAKKPVIAFLHSEPGSIKHELTDKDTKLEKKLVAFREKVQKKVCRYWKTPEELGGQASRSVVRLQKDRPGEGWVKARYATDPQEILRLRSTIEELESQVVRLRTLPPDGTENLCQGRDLFELPCRGRFFDGERQVFRWMYQKLSWDDIITSIGPYMLDDCRESTLRTTLTNRLEGQIAREVNDPVDNVSIDEESFQTIKFQLMALGIISSRNLKGETNYSGWPNYSWRLTPFGKNYLMKLKAIHKGDYSVDEEVPF